MGYYANQKSITVHKPQLKKDDIKVLIRRDMLEAAARNLTGNEFKLYVYLASNADGYEVDFSPKFFKRDYGVGEDTARKLMRILEDKGYLVRKDGFECLYDFYLEPQKKLDIVYVDEKRLVPTCKGLEPATFDEVRNSNKFKDKSEEVVRNFWNGLEVVKEGN